MRLKLSIIVKLVTLVVFLVIATAFAVNEVYVRGSSQILVERAIKDLEDETKSFSYPLGNRIEKLADDARLLARMPPLHGAIRARLRGGVDPIDSSTEQQWMDRLAIIFTEMLNTREYYDQVRFIGVAGDGKEILKIVRYGNRVERVPESKLQSQGQSRYVQDTLRLNPGELYLSEAELNREYGKISEPHLLVLRAAVPVYTLENDIYGIIVINMDLGAVLKNIKASVSQNRLLYITNSRGDYLIHPDSSKLYASDLGHETRIQIDSPQLLGIMNDQKQNQITVLPENTEQGSVITFRKYHYDGLNPDRYFGIAVETPYSNIVNDTAEVEQRGFVFSAVIALIAIAAAIILLRLSIRPLNRIADAVVRYRKGERTIELPTDSPDEIGVLAKEFQAMIRQKNEEDWVKENLVEISKSILGFRNLEDFAGALMEYVTMAVNAQIGVLYLSSSFGSMEDKRETETLILLGACGYKESDSLPRSFRWGEALVGQCAKDRNIRLVSDVPDDYLRIASALGDTKPKHILLLPVLFENTLVGVIELASIEGFSDVQRAFLEQLVFNAGVIINSISASMRTEELLEEARVTTEELQRSEEELKTQQEELEASNEEMEEKTKALEEQNAQIRQQAEDLDASKKMLEEKAKELELAGKYKSEFLANMSHELRTPLNSLLILARSLAANEEGNLTTEQIEEANVIYNGGLDLLSLINDILDLSKVEAGKLTLTVENVPLDGIVKRIEQQFDPLVKETGLQFNINLADDLPATMHTDSQRVEQILKNLLSNAFKFTEKGTVTLDIERPDNKTVLRRSSLEHDSTIAFKVTDTGIGVDESKLESIFEAFQQEEGSTDRQYGGTGLGLSIAQKFAYMLGGEIHAVSKKGKGSTFTLILPETWESEESGDAGQGYPMSLPVSTPAQKKASERVGLKAMPKASVKEFIADDRDSISKKDKTLLIIEDDRDFARILMKTAHKRGYKCLAAGDGKTGILLASEWPVSAIILDLWLPDIDGLNVLDQLKHDLRTRHIPVHIITGRDEEDTVVPLRKGAIGHLTKPVEAEDMDNVFTKIEDVLQSSIKKILLVEDDKKSQTAIQKLLKKKDVEIVCVGMGSTALQKAREERFDCIILDLLLPDMTGFDWLDDAEKQAGKDELPPVIIYTGKELTEDENRKLRSYTGSIVIKGAHSSERLLDEVTLFLHSVESTLSKDQQAMIRMQHNPDRVLQERKVLLVDDDLRNTFALSKLLKKHGMEVVIADNGEMALEKLGQEKGIELVIMDIMMPVMDGYQAMREIRAKKKWENLPIIALTARAMPEEQEKCIEAGANDYMVKPVDIERLLTLMRVWLFRQEEVA